MDYAIIAIYSFSIIFIGFLYYLYKKLNQNNIINFGSLFGLLSFTSPINSYFGYNELANICLTIHYSLYSYPNMIKSKNIDNIHSIGCGLVLLYYIKTTIDDWYKEKEKFI